MEETDLFFHLALGQRILADGAIPFRNLFSFTYPEAFDPDLAWGFQVLVAGLHRLGGFAAISLAKTVLVAAAAGLLFVACRRAGRPPHAAAVAVVLAVLASGQRIVERPHLCTLAGIGALHLLLATAERRPRALLWLPPLTLVWANFHAGVFFAPLTAGLWLLGARLDGVALPSRRVLAAALAGTALATFLSPAGATLPRYLLWHTGLGATRNIEEFRRVGPFNDPWFFLVLTLVLLTVVALRRKTPLRLLLPALAASLLALRSVRFAAEASLLAAPLVAAGLARIWPPRPAAAPLGAALVFALALTHARPATLGVPRDLVPLAAIDFATRNGLRDRMYSDLDVGCYLLWEGWPRYRVFQDARLPAYPDDFHRALDRAVFAPREMDALLARFGVDAALLNEPDRNFAAAAFSPARWALVYKDALGIVFARRGARHDRVIAAHELPLQAALADGRVEWRPLPAPPEGSPVEACSWQLRLAPLLEARGDPAGAQAARERALAGGCLDRAGEIVTRFHRAARLIAAGDLAAAEADYDRVLALDPGHAGAQTNRGFVRLRRGDREGAAADFARALAIDPTRADAREGQRRLNAPAAPSR